MAAPADKPIPEQVTFSFSRGGHARGKQAGVMAKCVPEAGGEQWTIAVDVLGGNPEVGSSLQPHGAPGTDRRKRVVTAVVKSEDKKNWVLTCTIQ